MINIKVDEPHDKDAFEKALSRFEKKCNKDGFIKEVRERQYFKKPSEKKREKIREYERKNRKKRK